MDEDYLLNFFVWVTPITDWLKLQLVFYKFKIWTLSDIMLNCGNLVAIVELTSTISYQTYSQLKSITISCKYNYNLLQSLASTLKSITISCMIATLQVQLLVRAKGRIFFLNFSITDWILTNLLSSWIFEHST